MRNLSNIGVEFTNTNVEARGEVQSYHCKPNPIFRTKAQQMDINGLKSEDRRNIIIDGDEFESKFTIGFEIEKTRLHRGSVQEYPLFCGFETDSSCGYEAVTHVLPLVSKSMWRTKVFNMFAEAKYIIEDRYSPSDYSCGGHITIGVNGMSGVELMNKVRENCGIILSIFRKRIMNRYCGGNVMMSEDSVNFGEKYVVAKPNSNSLEFRIPSRVTSVKQLMRRYELMYVLLDFSINTPNARKSVLYNRLKPIVASMYERDMDKVNKIMELAKHFDKFLKTKKVDQNTCGWLEGWWSRSRCRMGAVRSLYKRTYRPLLSQAHYVNEFMSKWQGLV